MLALDFQMATDQYGNYVIQHVLEHSVRPQDRVKVVKLVCNRVQDMACHKFASNIVEKCLVVCSQEDREQIINSALGDNGTSEPACTPTQAIFTMMTDRFGNYVLQRMMEVVVGAQRDVFIEVCRMCWLIYFRLGSFV